MRNSRGEKKKNGKNGKPGIRIFIGMVILMAAAFAGIADQKAVSGFPESFCFVAKAEEIKETKASASTSQISSGTVSKKSKKTQLDIKKLSLVQYQTQTLKLLNRNGFKVKWKSSDKSVAKVSAKGKVTAVGAGKCKITAKCNKKTYTCKVKVAGLRLSASQISLVRGRQKILTLNNDALDPVVWTSSDEKIATVTKSGRVQALSPGTCAITASWKKEVLICNVTVLPLSLENLRSANPADESHQGKIVLAGSSSVDLWKSAPQAFAPYEIINMAIGGSRTTQWLEWYTDSIVVYHPSAVVLYVGSNDLKNGDAVTGKENAANTITLLKKLKRALKNTPIYYVGICPCWRREGAWNEIRVSNQLVQNYCAETKNLYYISLTSSFMGADGKPNKALFLPDQLHPNEKGYKRWKKYVAKVVKREVKLRAKAAAKKAAAAKK